MLPPLFSPFTYQGWAFSNKLRLSSAEEEERELTVTILSSQWKYDRAEAGRAQARLVGGHETDLEFWRGTVTVWNVIRWKSCRPGCGHCG